MKMNKPIFFTPYELIHSETAYIKRIDNTPKSWDIIEHLIELGLFIDGIRIAYRKPIFVSSGYRCDELNTAVGGAKTSAHRNGYAVDLYVKGGKTEMDKFFNWLANYLKSNNLKWDQLLKESNSSGGYWIHLGLYSNSGEQRKQIKTLFVS